MYLCPSSCATVVMVMKLKLSSTSDTLFSVQRTDANAIPISKRTNFLFLLCFSKKIFKVISPITEEYS